MPELPEVETCKRGIAPYLLNQHITKITLRERRLRWLIPSKLCKILPGQTITQVARRGKYLLIACERGTLIIHLGMSGKIRVLSEQLPPAKHDHVDLYLSNDDYLRYTDPRRFGAWLWTEEDPAHHPLLKTLGPEPLSEDFNAAYLKARCYKKQTTIKQVIMDSKVVVGVGNIYANEALFIAGIRPGSKPSQLSLAKIQQLVLAIQAVLENAIAVGGTTLKDYRQADNQTGYFQLQLQVYGRQGLPCVQCQKPLIAAKINNRQTVYCRDCQV